VPRYETQIVLDCQKMLQRETLLTCYGSRNEANMRLFVKMFGRCVPKDWPPSRVLLLQQ
jgi:hypothetical protein